MRASSARVRAGNERGSIQSCRGSIGVEKGAVYLYVHNDTLSYLFFVSECDCCVLKAVLWHGSNLLAEGAVDFHSLSPQ